MNELDTEGNTRGFMIVARPQHLSSVLFTCRRTQVDEWQRLKQGLLFKVPRTICKHCQNVKPNSSECQFQTLDELLGLIINTAPTELWGLIRTYSEVM